MKHKRFAVILLLATLLAACTPVTTPTVLPSTPTLEAEPTRPSSSQTQDETATAPSEAVPTPNLGAEDTPEPGGVEVALDLVTIPDQETIALVNGEEISTAAYQEELERALYSVTAQYVVDWNDEENRSRLPAFQEQVLDQLVERTLLRQLAKQEGIAADPEAVEAEIASLQSQIEQDPSFADWESFLTQNNLTEEVIRILMADELLVDALAEKHGGSQVAEQVHASHILVETEETGQEVLDKLDAGEDFAALAAEYSTDPGSKDQGGDLGWFPRGMMVSEFEEAAFSLEPGETSGLVQSAFGYHIIQVHEKEERELDPALYAQAQQQQFQAWFETQRAEASIERLYTFEEQSPE